MMKFDTTPAERYFANMFIEPNLGGRTREQAGWIEVICARTGQLASHSFRLSENDQQVLPGKKDRYEARSRTAFLDVMKDRKQ